MHTFKRDLPPKTSAILIYICTCCASFIYFMSDRAEEGLLCAALFIIINTLLSVILYIYRPKHKTISSIPSNQQRLKLLAGHIKDVVQELEASRGALRVSSQLSEGALPARVCLRGNFNINLNSINSLLSKVNVADGFCWAAERPHAAARGDLKWCDNLEKSF